jgi:hypothetical protein
MLWTTLGEAFWGGLMSKQRLIVCLFLFAFGLIPLFNSTKNPRLQALHGSDFVQLIAAGLCFGVAFGLLLSRKFRDD